MDRLQWVYFVQTEDKEWDYIFLGIYTTIVSVQTKQKEMS